MQTPAQEQHRWLRQFVGQWTVQSECVMGPDQPPQKSSGRETVRALGDLWIVGEGEFEMGGDTGRSILTVGFDPARGRFVGSWVGSMMSHLWVYDGELSGNTLALNCQGPSFTGEGMANYRDVHELRAPDHRVLTAQLQAPDGSWRTFMTGEYRRSG